MAKRPTSQPQQNFTVKRRKVSNGKSKASSSKDPIAEVVRLEKLVEDALASNTSLNPIADLLLIASDTEGEDEVVVKAIFALYRIFVQIARKNLLVTTEKQDTETEEDKAQRSVIRSWISGKLDAFSELLCSLLKDEDKSIRASSLKLLFSLLREISAAQKAFDVKYFKKIVFALLTCPSSHRNSDDGESPEIDTDVRDQFCDNWLNTHVDVRWYFLRETSMILNNRAVLDKNPFVVANAIAILEKLQNIPKPSSKSVLDGLDGNNFWVECLATVPKRSKDAEKDDGDDEEDDKAEDDAEEDDWRKFFDEDTKPTISTGKTPARRHRRVHAMNIHEQLHSIQAHRAVFTKCWLTLLPLLSTSQSKTHGDKADPRDALVIRVLDIMHHSILPHLTRPILVMDWIAGCVDYGGIVGLLALNALFVLITEYNLDYPRFYTKLYSFLDRDVLHFKHQARFFRLLERFLSSSHLPLTLLASFLKRLARLSLSTSPAAIIPTIPFTYNLLKTHPALMVLIHRAAEDGTDDPFNPSESDPTQTCALESSLWELQSHTSHYHPVVATLARVFSEAFTKPGYNMEDFLDHTYGTLFTTEAKRTIKGTPALQIESNNRAGVLSDSNTQLPVLKGTLFC
ncbi:CBF-domain-containing protein [Schizopora paradoxa]|uniref:CBF-domain-containing protein n=1 Tax=Schizopora paradoxa TaxID=27342 RepID=A0A0H2RWA4_9AGAM|nr:CBF-domain-containing protein [Schizopora paradoxa]